MALRVRFRVTERADLYYSPTSKRLTFAALEDASVPTDDRISQGAPSITFTAICDSPAAVAMLELGTELYFDISPIPDLKV